MISPGIASFPWREDGGRIMLTRPVDAAQVREQLRAKATACSPQVPLASNISASRQDLEPGGRLPGFHQRAFQGNRIKAGAQATEAPGSSWRTGRPDQLFAELLHALGVFIAIDSSSAPATQPDLPADAVRLASSRSIAELRRRLIGSDGSPATSWRRRHRSGGPARSATVAEGWRIRLPEPTILKARR